MSLEISDLNDGVILNATKQRNDANGNIQFHLELPSGRSIHSEWISPDHKRQALQTWLTVAKEQIAQDVEESRAAKRRAAQQAADSLRPGPVIEVPAGTIPQVVDQTVDPMEFVQQQFNMASDDVDRLRMERNMAQAALEMAEHRLQKWQTLHNALTGQTGDGDNVPT